MKSKDLIYIAGQAPGRKGRSVQYKVKHILYHISCILRFLESEIKRSDSQAPGCKGSLVRTIYAVIYIFLLQYINVICMIYNI